MDNIDFKDPIREPYLPFPPEKKPDKKVDKTDKQIEKEKSGDVNNKDKDRDTQDPIKEPYLPFPPEKKINKQIIEDKVNFSWKNSDKEGIDLGNIKDVFIKSNSVF